MRASTPWLKSTRALHRYPHAVALQLRTGREPQVPDFSDDILETWRSDHVVIHQDEIFLGPIMLIDSPDQVGQRLRIALAALKLRNAAEMAFADASA